MKLILFLLIIGAALVLILKCYIKLEKKQKEIRKKSIVTQIPETEEDKKIVGTALQLYGQDSKLPVIICRKTPEAEEEDDKALYKFVLICAAIILIAFGLMIAVL